jgi:hypothetical protein
MLADDLAAAGVPYVVQGPDGPLYADFHALRHTYISTLTRAGLSAKQVQELARHATAELSIGRYSHAELPELGEAVGRLLVLIGPTAEAHTFPTLRESGEAAAPLVNVPEADYRTLTTLARLALALLASGGDVSVALPVALNFEPAGDGTGRPGTERVGSVREAG